MRRAPPSNRRSVWWQRRHAPRRAKALRAGSGGEGGARGRLLFEKVGQHRGGCGVGDGDELGDAHAREVGDGAEVGDAAVLAREDDRPKLGVHVRVLPVPPLQDDGLVVLLDPQQPLGR
eukprot:5949527-Prymnesium_polylepis.1